MPLEGQIGQNPIPVTKLLQMPVKGQIGLNPINVTQLLQMPLEGRIGSNPINITELLQMPLEGPKLEKKIQLMFTQTPTGPKYYPKKVHKMLIPKFIISLVNSIKMFKHICWPKIPHSQIII